MSVGLAGTLQLAPLSNQLALEGKAVKRVQVLRGTEVALGLNCASYYWYSVNANVSSDAMGRAGLERLCRYVLRSPERFPGYSG